MISESPVTEVQSINRNIVECKDWCLQFHNTRFNGINRNIVECKEDKYTAGGVASNCINRNIVECKGFSSEIRLFSLIVLIETLWNVKQKSQEITKLDFYSINRNIVECKVITKRKISDI